MTVTQHKGLAANRRRFLQWSGIAGGTAGVMGLGGCGLQTRDAQAADPNPEDRRVIMLTQTHGFWSGASTILVFAAVALMGFLLYRLASGQGRQLLSMLAVSAFVLALAGEFIGRQLFYASMVTTGGM